jgi:hypothetical protein
MTPEFEFERSKRQKSSDGPAFESALFNAENFVRAAERELPNRFDFEGRSVPTADVSADFAAHQEQNRVLERHGVPAPAVQLKLTTPIGVTIDVISPVRVKLAPAEDPAHRVVGTIEELLRAGLKAFTVSPREAEKYFRERAADFIAVRAAYVAAGGPPNPNVTVTTNRAGDTIIYSKGYFYSTQTGFGTSTPASNHLPAGRYDFGILVSKHPHWSGVLWSVPASGSIHVPLP